MRISIKKIVSMNSSITKLPSFSWAERKANSHGTTKLLKIARIKMNISNAFLKGDWYDIM